MPISGSFRERHDLEASTIIAHAEEADDTSVLRHVPFEIQ
jgi:hypothetical protein